ncbi:MAG: HD domain-containing phosphohydrolase [Steroidobacteraceae bacterium]
MHVDQHYVRPEQLCLGLYVHLDLGWMDHPFTFSSFLIKTDRQIETIRKLGLARIRYEPEKSVCPRPAEQVASDTVAEPVAQAGATAQGDHDAADQEVMAAKRARTAHLERIKQQIGAVEQQFRRAADSMRSITRNLATQPVEAHREGTQLVNEIVDTVFGKTDVMLHAMSEKMGEDAYFHPLNVTVLSLILGRALGFDSAALREVGLGALFHDIGKTKVPRNLLTKQEAFTSTENVLMEQHCSHGLALARAMGLSEEGQAMIMQHHEYLDGSGYPSKLSGAALSPFVRVVSIANTYDNLCNPRNLAQALTPSESLSRMFASMRTKLDEMQLQMFIRCLGVYPPGSIVQLSNEMVCLVLASSSTQPMRPNVLIYDPEVPKDDGAIICLEQEPELKITKSLRPAHLPREIYQYLNPRKRVAYYFDPQQQGTEP